LLGLLLGPWILLGSTSLHAVLLLLQVSLFEVMPSMCVGDLVKILDDYARDQ
jgi:hypothetical protein